MLFYLKNGTIVEILSIFTASDNCDTEKVTVRGHIMDLESLAYMYPSDNSIFDMYKGKKRNVESPFPLNQITPFSSDANTMRKSLS